MIGRRRFIFLGVGLLASGAVDPRALLPRYRPDWMWNTAGAPHIKICQSGPELSRYLFTDGVVVELANPPTRDEEPFEGPVFERSIAARLRALRRRHDEVLYAA